MSNGKVRMIKVTLVKSVIGATRDQRATVRGLGLRRINHCRELPDTAAVRGMVKKVSFLLRHEKCEVCEHGLADRVQTD